MDFESQSLRDALSESGFAWEDEGAVFSWIGVTMYLAREAIEATLDTIANGAPGTRIVLTYDQPPGVLDERDRAVPGDVSGTAAKWASRSSAFSHAMR